MLLPWTILQRSSVLFSLLISLPELMFAEKRLDFEGFVGWTVRLLRNLTQVAQGNTKEGDERLNIQTVA